MADAADVDVERPVPLAIAQHKTRGRCGCAPGGGLVDANRSTSSNSRRVSCERPLVEKTLLSAEREGFVPSNRLRDQRDREALHGGAELRRRRADATGLAHTALILEAVPKDARKRARTTA